MKRVHNRRPLEEIDPNVRYNRLDVESVQDRDARREAEAKEKKQRVRQQAIQRGDTVTPSPSLSQSEQHLEQHTEQYIRYSRCQCDKPTNQFQQEKSPGRSRTCQTCRDNKHDVRDEQSTEQEQSIKQGTPVQTHRLIEEHQDHNNNAFLQEPAVLE